MPLAHALPAASPALQAQLPNSATILARMQRLGRVATVLYVAAHPDDENSRLLAWLAGERGLRAVYLSLTRGDGGQNLIGAEQDELLGLLRTWELMAARSVDGAEQRFTRARDFGYSKTTAETLKIWGQEPLLADVVRVVRELRPDAIVTRFTPLPPNHGHHMASAELAALAFTAAAQKDFAQEPGGPGPWQAARLLHNVTLFNRKIEDVRAPYQVDVGGYSALLGKSWGDLAAASRSQHKSQGFGVAAARGKLPEFFELLGGSTPKGSDPFADLPSSWARFAGGAAVDQRVAELLRGYDPLLPQNSLPALAKVHQAIAAMPADNPYRQLKLAEVEGLLAACAGLWLEARAAHPEVVPGSDLQVNATALLGNPAQVKWLSVQLAGPARGQTPGQPLGPALTLEPVELAVHASRTAALSGQIPGDAAPSTPYWLRQAAEGGLYALPDRDAISQPVDQPPIIARFTLSIQGITIHINRPVQFLWADPVRGEQTRDVEIAPPLTLTPDRPVVLAPRGQAVTLNWQIARSETAGQAAVDAEISFAAPPGWQVEPQRQRIRLGGPTQILSIPLTIRPISPQVAPGELKAEAEVAGRRWSLQQQTVDYEHVPRLTVRKPAQVRLVPADLRLGRPRIGYIAGPGDRVAESLQAVGYQVSVLSEAQLAKDDLKEFNAIAVGVRALNAQPKLVAHWPKLLRWVEAGGRLVVQYQTNSRVGPLTVAMGPYPLEIGRDRVTDETAAIRWETAGPAGEIRGGPTQNPMDALRNSPNQLGEADFAGWVQERGLYFAKSWDPRYLAPLRMKDPGEADQAGALLVAPHGKGQFIYTGLAFFRQLPAGVPGAYRLFANLLGP